MNGEPFEVFLLVIVKPTVERYLRGEMVVHHIFAGNDALGRAQREQRRVGGFVVPGYGWMTPQEAEHPQGHMLAISRTLVDGQEYTSG